MDRLRIIEVPMTTENPYSPPQTLCTLESPGGDAYDRLLERLVRGENVDELSISDVSDFHLMGRKHWRRLPERLQAEARQAGLESYAYQSVWWFCVLCWPVFPCGTYLIIPYVNGVNPRD